MRREIIFIILIIVAVSFAGCSMLGKPGSTATTKSAINKASTAKTGVGTPTVPPIYSRGDVVKQFDYDRIGKMVIDYNPKTDSYTSASIIYDEFGRLFYFDSTKTANSKRESFEVSYPFKSGHIGNPDSISVMKREYKEKYKTGQIISGGNHFEGILILRYDYSNDHYRYTDARKQDAQWLYNLNVTNTDSRTAIEKRYNKVEATVKLP